MYYPDIDDGLKGGLIELTRVMTGGCGSRYPSSTDVPIRKGSAVVFENKDTFHRMTALELDPAATATATATTSKGGTTTFERTVVAFFLQSGVWL